MPIKFWRGSYDRAPQREEDQAPEGRGSYGVPSSLGEVVVGELPSPAQGSDATGLRSNRAAPCPIPPGRQGTVGRASSHSSTFGLSCPSASSLSEAHLSATADDEILDTAPILDQRSISSSASSLSRTLTAWTSRTSWFNRTLARHSHVSSDSSSEGPQSVVVTIPPSPSPPTPIPNPSPPAAPLPPPIPVAHSQSSPGFLASSWSRLGKLARKAGAGPGTSMAPPGLPTVDLPQPVCLICLDTLTQEEFISGEAIALECQCKGEVAYRHKKCAIKWSQVKGSTICDVCKHPITNLPPVAPRQQENGHDEMDGDDIDGLGQFMTESVQEPPATADYVFDCVRVTWVTMIICVLFFELTVMRSFMVGAVVGLAYTIFNKTVQSAAQQARQELEGGQQHNAVLV